MKWVDASTGSAWLRRYDLHDAIHLDRGQIILTGNDREWFLFVGGRIREAISAATAERWLADPELLVMELTL